MARIRYKGDEEAGPEELVRSIRARRGGDLLNLDRILLYSPPYAKGWNAFLGAVRNELSLPARLRELAICCVAVLNGADYEFSQHGPEFLKAGGTAAQLQALRDWRGSVKENSLFQGAEAALLRLTFEMTRKVCVGDGTFSLVRDFLPEEQVVELVGVIAAYNMVSRFLVALEIEPD